MVDALGDEIVIGRKYGYASDCSGYTNVTTGVALRETKERVTLTVVSCMWDYAGNLTESSYISKTVSVKSVRLFRIFEPKDFTAVFAAIDR